MIKNVLIITYCSPPLNNIAARRFGELAKYMEDFGWRPYILTTNAKGDLAVNIPFDQIIRIGSNMQSSTRIDNINRPLPFPFSTLKKCINILKLRVFSIDHTVFTWRKEVKISSGQLNNLPDMQAIIASFGPASTLWLGKYYAKLMNIPWIADYRDLGALSEVGGNNIVLCLDKMIEKNLLSSASAIISVSSTLACLLGKAYNKSSHVIYNGFDEADYVNNQLKEKNPYIYYAGRFLLHQLASIFLLLEAMKDISNINLKIRSLGPLIIENEIMKKAIELGVEDRLELLQPASQKQLHLEHLNAKINLVVEEIEKKADWSRGTLTGKFLRLLPYKAPVLSIARPDNEMGQILKETNKGILCSSKQEIEEFLKNPNLGTQYIGNNRIAFYSKKYQAKKLCEVLDVIVLNNVKQGL